MWKMNSIRDDTSEDPEDPEDDGDAVTWDPKDDGDADAWDEDIFLYTHTHRQIIPGHDSHALPTTDLMIAAHTFQILT